MVMMRRLSLLPCLLPCLLTAGCAATDAGPSLQRRPVETQGLETPERRPAPSAPAGAALATRIAALRAQAEAAHRDFLSLAAEAGTAGAAAPPVGSEAWVAAQQRLSTLEARRGPAVAALADIDSLIIAGLVRSDDAGIAELEAAQADLARMIAAQDAAIAAIRGRLAG
jgi:hypothetical protein